jgi:hypothetical protein
MKATVKKIEIAQKKKKGPSAFYSVLLFVVVAGGIAYYLRDQPLALQLRDAIDRLLAPTRGMIESIFRPR